MSDPIPNPVDIEAAVAALCPKPKHLMSEQELREDTARLRNIRDNRQSFMAMVRGESDEVDNKNEQKQVFNEFL